MAGRMLQVRLMTVLTAAVALVAAGGITALALDGRGGHDHADHAHLDTASGLLVSNRSALRICVESGSPRREAVRGDLLAAMELVRGHPHWSSAYGRFRYAGADALDWGCPAPRLPQRFDRTTSVAGPGVTDDPSAYRLWIYILDEATADRVLGAGEATAIAAAELMRGSDALFPVSTALLIRRDRLADTVTAASDLQAALGLRSPSTDQEEETQ